jgi:hypothetical protein
MPFTLVAARLDSKSLTNLDAVAATLDDPGNRSMALRYILRRINPAAFKTTGKAKK